ncbi:MAG TPA: hypothetical protein V6D07_16655 [Trichocoleus sp.]
MSAFQQSESFSSLTLADQWQSPPLPNSDPVLQGTRYLETLRQITLKSVSVDLVGDLSLRLKMCGWIGLNIYKVNRRLQALLEDCQACFYPSEQPAVQIFAAPLAASLALDGVCNILSQPTTLLIDTGRVVPEDWLGAVAHEYAHAVVASPGHSVRFRQVLTHLCLGLGLLPPSSQKLSEALESWPPCRANPNPQGFWLGEMALSI